MQIPMVMLIQWRFLVQHQKSRSRRNNSWKSIQSYFVQVYQINGGLKILADRFIITTFQIIFQIQIYKTRDIYNFF
jgi:hypothetical protein